MAIKIEKKIVNYKVNESAPHNRREEDRQLSIETMNEDVQRPESLTGTTYKMKPTNTDHALYITINDFVLNQGTVHEIRRPFEIFINSKSMEHFQWVVALTRVISATWRKGGDVTFMVDELKAVFDPNGGYYKKGGQYIPSLVAEFGMIIERHLIMIGLIKAQELNPHQKALIADKKAALATAGSNTVATQPTPTTGETLYPAHAEICKKCFTKSVIMQGGCNLCLNCSDSKCQ